MDERHQVLLEENPGNEILYISGKAHSGADKLVIVWCRDRGYHYIEVPADWKDIEVKGAVVAYDSFGRPYNKRAGHMRNEVMAKIATHLIAFWDLKSPGTKGMLDLGDKYDLKKFRVIIDIEEETYEF